MNEKYYPKEIEIVLSHINQFNYSDKYISIKDLKLLLEKDIPLSIEELEKVLINSSKIFKMTDFVKNLKISAKIELEKKHLYLFYYSLNKFYYLVTIKIQTSIFLKFHKLHQYYQLFLT